MPSVEGISPKYIPLYHFLVREGREGHKYLQMTFDDVESIIDAPLPSSARTQLLFWNNLRQPRRASTAWYRAGWEITNVDIQSETLTFCIVQ